MKKTTSLLMTLCLIASLLAGIMTNDTDASAGVLTTFPVALTAPTNVTLSPYLENDSKTSKVLSFTMDDAMLAYVSKTESEKDAIAKDGGYSSYKVYVDIDWAFDDPNAWHLNDYWNWLNPNPNLGNGLDENGEYRLNPWDVVSNSECIRARAVNDVTLFTYDKADESNEKWTGVYKTPGLKTTLDPTWYTVDNDKTIHIDWTKHTIYARLRWCVAAYKTEGNRTVRDLAFSYWSEPAAFGAAASSSDPYVGTSMPVPSISNLRMTADSAGEYPNAYVDIAVPDDVQKKASEIIANGGTFALDAYAKVYGDAEWIHVDTNLVDIKSDTFMAYLKGLMSVGKPIALNAPIEFRARYVSDQHDAAGNSLGTLRSGWSTVLTQNTESIAASSGAKKGADENSAYRYMTEIASGNTDVTGSSFGSMFAKQNSSSTGLIGLGWKHNKKAAKYKIFGGKISDSSFYILGGATGTGTSLTQINGEEIVPGQTYKIVVMAIDGNGKVLKT
ncbi:MAG: hypothetical protein J5819_01545, partial [Eubacterium sp.]|nr:hypothetical protein [Eubacterium sp.]